jgi:hypothetical protein
MPLLVGTPDQTEMVFKQAMALQPHEFTRDLATSPADDLGHGNLAVVVTDPAWHPTKKLERPSMTFQEYLRAFSGKHLAEDGVRVRQRHHEDGDRSAAATRGRRP